MTDVLTGRKTIALVAHDNCKADLVQWAEYNRTALADHNLIATGTTGNILEHELGLPVERLQSGPLGGDMQIGARISDGAIDAMVFFWDPLEAQPHDPDVKALLRVAVVWNIPVACNRATADFLVSSPLMTTSYERRVPDYRGHNERLALAGLTMPSPTSHVVVAFDATPPDDDVLDVAGRLGGHHRRARRCRAAMHARGHRPPGRVRGR